MYAERELPSLLCINQKDLRLILSEHGNEIGRRWYESLDRLIAGVGLLMTVVFTEIKIAFLGIDIKSALIIASLSYLAWGVRAIYKSIVAPFTDEHLLNELMASNQMDMREHSVVIIMDTFNDIPNRYLVYDDKRWGVHVVSKLSFHPTGGL